MTNKEPNPNFTPPPTTSSNAINPVIGTKCPYRKIYFPKTWWSGSLYPEVLMKATRIEIEFQDCLDKDCACWTPLGCGRK